MDAPDQPSPAAALPRYNAARADVPPSLAGPWDGADWRRVGAAEVNHFRPESSNHRPRTQAKLLYDDTCIYGLFRVEDRYVRSVGTRFGDPVCQDSCVEFFVRPKADRGYLNFEFNGGGVLLASYIEDPTRVPGGFAKFTRLAEEDGARVRIHHSLPAVVEPEVVEPVTWSIGFAIPRVLLEAYVGPLGALPGQRWRANFYKCGDRTSHPHWAAWAPVDRLNFHLPNCFGVLTFQA